MYHELRKRGTGQADVVGRQRSYRGEDDAISFSVSIATWDPHPALRADPGSSPGQALPLSGGGLPPGERSRSGARPGGGASGALPSRGPNAGRAARSSLPLKGGGIGWGSQRKLARIGTTLAAAAARPAMTTS